MQTQLKINNTNLTPYIIDGSYSVESEDVYESWKNANYLEHRVIIASKVSGSCEIVCGNKRNAITVASLLSAISAATTATGVTTVMLWVCNKGQLMTIDCYLKVEAVRHETRSNGEFIDVLKLTFTER